MSTVTPLKVIVAGHVNGQVEQLLEKVNNLSKKTTFDTLLVAGDLFPDRLLSDGELDLSWIDKLRGDYWENLPASIYVMGPRTDHQKKYFKTLLPVEENEGNDNESLLTSGFDSLDGKMTVLGRKGVMKSSDGLTIVYLNGNEETGMNNAEVDDLLSSLSSGSDTTTDILITPFWPKGVHQGSSISVPNDVVSRSTGGSLLISKLVTGVKPRYHITGSVSSNDLPIGVYYERQPYRNHVVLAESNKPVTRFVSLASINSEKKGPKWLYAFNIRPASNLIALDKRTGGGDGRKELNCQPDDTTEPPYRGMTFQSGAQKPRGGSGDNVQYFFQMPQHKRNVRDQTDSRHNANQHEHSHGQQFQHNQERSQNQRHEFQRNNDGERRRQGDQPLHLQEKRPRPEPIDPESCWFCLSSPKVEKEYVVSVGDNAYLATAKGGLVKDHLLILPVAHKRCYLEIEPEVQDEIVKFKDSLKQFFESQEKTPAFFERNFKSQHMQVQVFPLPKDCLRSLSSGDNDDNSEGNGDDDQPTCHRRVMNVICGIIRRNGLKWKVLPSDETLADHVKPGIPYMFLEIPALSLKILIFIDCRPDSQGNRKQINLQLGREIIAEILGLNAQEVLDWQKVSESLTKDQEAKRTIDVRKRFQPFDFTISEDDDM